MACRDAAFHFQRLPEPDRPMKMKGRRSTAVSFSFIRRMSNRIAHLSIHRGAAHAYTHVATGPPDCSVTKGYRGGRRPCGETVCSIIQPKTCTAVTRPNPRRCRASPAVADGACLGGTSPTDGPRQPHYAAGQSASGARDCLA